MSADRQCTLWRALATCQAWFYRLSGSSLGWGRQAVGFYMETSAGEGEKDV